MKNLLAKCWSALAVAALLPLLPWAQQSGIMSDLKVDIYTGEIAFGNESTKHDATLVEATLVQSYGRVLLALNYGLITANEGFGDEDTFWRVGGGYVFERNTHRLSVSGGYYSYNFNVARLTEKDGAYAEISYTRLNKNGVGGVAVTLGDDRRGVVKPYYEWVLSAGNITSGGNPTSAIGVRGSFGSHAVLIGFTTSFRF